jgi:predicted patatin/cPLA2 family phospholipase
LRVLAGFADLDELMLAVRASTSLPRLGGAPPVYRGERMSDGAIIEPIPYESPLREGATHVLVLRSRSAGYRQPAFSGLGGALALRDDPGLVELVRDRPRVYNRQAAALERAASRRGGDVLQVAVSHQARVVGGLESSGERVVEALRLGAKALAAAIFTDPIELCWQPVVYRAAPGRAYDSQAPKPGTSPSSSPR